MKDNLPEINIGPRKTEKKGGFLGFLRGLGSGGARIGAAAGGSSAGGIGGMIAGNIGTILTIAAVAVSGGVYMARNTASTPIGVTSGSLSSNRSPDSNYVPAILKSQQANQGSSLAMFTDTNKGSGLSLDEAAAANKAAAAASAGKTEEAADNKPTGEQPPDPNAVVAGAMAGMTGGGAGAGSSLTSQLGGGGGSNRMMLGGGNKPQAALGAGKLSGGVGSGFSAMPKFQDRKSKLLAMKSAARPISGASKAGKGSKYGKGAFNQSKALRSMQKSYTGTNADSMRATQDAAWSGTTGTGSPTEGAGLGDGGEGAGIATSPSLDNPSSGGGDNTQDSTSAGSGKTEEDNPWKDLANEARNYILYAAALAVIGGILIQAAEDATGSVVGNIGVSEALYALGYMILALGAYFAGMAMYDSIKLMCDPYNQYWVGGIYCAGAACALTALGVAAFGDMSEGAMINTLWFTAGTALAGLAGTIVQACVD